MNAKADVALLTTLAALEALERGPRKYVPPVEAEWQEQEQDAEQFFYDQQCPSDSTFR